MKTICGKQISERIPCVATIGTFDGIHLGHRLILEHVVGTARLKKVRSVVITFDILPQEFFRRKPHLKDRARPKPFTGYLTDREQKTALIASCGVDRLWFLKTEESLLDLKARDFFAYLSRSLDIRMIIVGSDFRFGHGSHGNVGTLQKIAAEQGFEVRALRKKRMGGEEVSSSRIRALIRAGRLPQAATLLGRCVCVRGIVVQGQGIGSRALVATANIDTGTYCMPDRGIYAGACVALGAVYPCVISIGTRPTVVSGGALCTEVHIIGFKKNIVGKKVTVFFFEKIRSEKKFPSLADLKAAIRKDIVLATSKYSTARSLLPQELVF